MRVLEIGCGTGAAARAIAHRVSDIYVLGIDRSARAITQANAGSRKEIASGRLGFRVVAIEDFELQPDEMPFHVAFAVRVGALDGRHPTVGVIALKRIASALTKSGRLFVDGGSPLREIDIGAA